MRAPRQVPCVGSLEALLMMMLWTGWRLGTYSFGLVVGVFRGRYKFEWI